MLEEADPIPGNDLSRALEFNNGVRLIPRVVFDPASSIVRAEITLQTINGPVPEKVFVHLLCGEEIIDQATGAMLAEIYPYDFWSAGETWHETRLLQVPDGTPRDCLAVRVGMFNPATGVRPALLDGSEWVVIPVESQ